MSLLTENGMIQEIPCGTNYTYVLAEGVQIQPTEYKVMQDQNVNCLVRCMRMKYNCRDALFYQTGGLKSFLTELRTGEAEEAAELIVALLKSVVDLKNIGFLSCTNIDGSLHKVFLDAHTNQVRLIYAPINQHFYSDDTSFENAIRGSLVQQIDNLPEAGEKLRELRNDLVNKAISLDEVVCKAIGDVDVTLGNAFMDDGAAKLRLTAMNAPMPFEMIVNQNEYRIGKSPAMDGVIKYNMYVGRVHCKILRNGNCFLVVDLDSKNGTFLGKEKLEAFKPYELHDGDTLTLANSDFHVTVQEGGV